MAKKSLVKKSPVKKSPVKKSLVKKSLVKKSPVKKSPVKKSPAKKSPAKKSPAKKSPAKKSLKGGGKYGSNDYMTHEVKVQVKTDACGRALMTAIQKESSVEKVELKGAYLIIHTTDPEACVKIANDLLLKACMIDDFTVIRP
jgi:hypothetical protein